MNLDSPIAAGPIAATSARRGVLFTAFEPSGDEHASRVVAELRRRHADLPIYAWGGARMERAGATVIERTGDDAVMGLPGLAKIREHQRINQRVQKWLEQHPIAVHVPVDSPAANFPICELTRAAGARIVHLVAPQIWAWGRWRIHRLRRLTDMVLCLLPFEERFFAKRGVPSRFIGHVLFDQPTDGAALDKAGEGFPRGHPRIAMMPGSRPEEIRRNFPLILDIFRALRRDFPDASGVIAATNLNVEQMLRDIAAHWLAARTESVGDDGWPAGLSCVVGDTDAVIRWCNLALVKSGTVTLQVAKQTRPMVIFYKKSNPVAFFVARVILSTKFFALPNVIAHREVVPEFVPHFGGPGPIIRAARALLASPRAADRQRAALDEVVSKFVGRNAAAAAADAIEEVAGIRAANLARAPA